MLTGSLLYLRDGILRSRWPIEVAAPTKGDDAARKQDVEAAIGGLTWRAPVLGIADDAPTEAEGDRYLVSASPTAGVTANMDNFESGSISSDWTSRFGYTSTDGIEAVAGDAIAGSYYGRLTNATYKSELLAPASSEDSFFMTVLIPSGQADQLWGALDAGGNGAVVSFYIHETGTIEIRSADFSNVTLGTIAVGEPVSLKFAIDSAHNEVEVFADGVSIGIGNLNDPDGAGTSWDRVQFQPYGEGDEYFIDQLHQGTVSPDAGKFDGHANEVAEFDGTAWTFAAPAEGWALVNEGPDPAEYLWYNGTGWERIANALSHNAMQGLQGGASGDRYHLTQTQRDDLTGAGDPDNQHAHAHNAQTGLQGGHAGEYYHLTASEWSALVESDDKTQLPANVEQLQGYTPAEFAFAPLQVVIGSVTVSANSTQTVTLEAGEDAHRHYIVSAYTEGGARVLQGYDPTSDSGLLFVTPQHQPGSPGDWQLLIQNRSAASHTVYYRVLRV